ncbi:MAG: hypothetical protein JSV04_08880 [Candidatus Heimdallarchaeota archaeon]|nr:MAG: hypothetical protein JSV04_08880 [Candidatus Heimdallarchaeota archaeon]
MWLSVIVVISDKQDSKNNAIMILIVSRLKQLFQKLKKSQESEETSVDEQDIAESEPPKPARGWRRVLVIFKLYFPLGTYQRALDWHLVTSSDSLISTDSNANQESNNLKIIQIQEKSFRSRFVYFCSRTILQSVGLSIVLTAPISLPWIFLVVIPFSIDLLPLGLSDMIYAIINTILQFLEPLSWIVDVVNIASNFFGTYSPVFFYGSTLWFFTMLGITDIEVFEAIENSEGGTASMIELMGSHFQSKFTLIQDFIIPFLLLVAGSISFFLVVRRARSILFEIQTEKELTKNIEKTKRTLLSYYIDEGYLQAEYAENRAASSGRMKWLARLTKYGPIVSVILPIFLAIIIIFV